MKKETLKIKVEGEEITNLVYLPEGEIKGIILFCHGFPGTNRLNELKEEAAKRNFSLIEVNYRGDKLSEGKFSFFKAIKDIQAVAEKTRKENPKTYFCGLGYSAGGLYTANVARNKPELFDKVVFLSPVIDSKFFSESPLMKELWEAAKNSIRLESKGFYEKEIQLMNEKFNAIDFAAEIKIRINIVQSEKDEVIPIKKVEEFYSKLTCEKNLSFIKDATHDLKGNEEELIKALFNEGEK